MKKQMILLLAMIVAGTTITFAQGGGGGFRQRTVEERVLAVHQKVDSAFKPDAAKLTQVDSVFDTYYRATDKVRQELMSGGERPDREVMMQKMQPATEARDKELKALLGDDNFKKFKDEIEPSMRRGGGGGGGNRQQ